MLRQKLENSLQILFIFSCVIFFAGKSAQAADNLAVNGGFENGLSNWGFWARETTAGSVTIENTGAHLGGQCAAVVHNGTQDWTLYQQQQLAVKAGEVYQIAGFVRVKQIQQGSLNISIVLRDEKDQVLSWTYALVDISTTTTGWRELKGFLYIPKGGAKAQVRLVGYGKCDALIDDVSFVKTNDFSPDLDKIKGRVYTLENSCLKLSLNGGSGGIDVTDKRINYNYKSVLPLLPPLLREVAESGAALDLKFYSPLNDQDIQVKLELISPGGVSVEVNSSAESGFDHLDYPYAFAMEEKSFLLLPEYSNGYLVATDDTAFPRWSWSGSPGDTGWNWGDEGYNIDLPFIGIVDGNLQKGYGLIMETPWDAAVYFEKIKVGEKSLAMPKMRWQASKGKFAYPRKVVIEFVDSGGYVALAKRLRHYLGRQGFLKTFAAKVRERANISKLMGACDVWGGDSDFAGQAKRSGIDRMILHGHTDEAGYLTSAYDNYLDILPLDAGHPQITNDRSPLPDHAYKNADDSPVQGWVTWDKAVVYMRRCAALAKEAAAAFIPPILKKYPYQARFLDCHTAMPLYQCYDKDHPLTRQGDMAAKQRLAEYVSSLGLVVGGEHGRWWNVPYVDYFEGMMSGNKATWPAGYLLGPAAKEEIGESYLKWDIGHFYRIPLFELVFHDCAATTWYWGDSTDFLYRFMPEISDKKDAFNVLYGTLPIMWAAQRPNQAGYGWKENRERFIQSYRNTCKLHEIVGWGEMVSHEFLTGDRNVQKTRFLLPAGGTVESTVNFGSRPYNIADLGKNYILSENDFFVKGEGVLQYKAGVGGKRATFIKVPASSLSKTAPYAFVDGGGSFYDGGILGSDGDVAAKVMSDKQIKLICAGTPALSGLGGRVLVRPKKLLPNWNISTTKISVLDKLDKAAREIKFSCTDGQTIEFSPQSSDLIEGVAAYQLECVPLSVELLSITTPRDGAKVSGLVPIELAAYNNFNPFKVELYSDGVLNYTNSDPPDKWLWDTKDIPEGGHLIKIVIFDENFNKIEKSLTVTVKSAKSASADLNNVKAYPSPYNPAKHPQGMKIEGLTAGAVVKIYTVTGGLIRELKEMGNLGGVSWDGRNEGGRLVASGVYIAHIKGATGIKKIKLAVEK